MPTDNTRQAPVQPGVELVLPGDFGSPAEVIADQYLSAAQKRDILLFWKQDLLRKKELEDARKILRTVEKALSDLEEAH